MCFVGPLGKPGELDFDSFFASLFGLFLRSEASIFPWFLIFGAPLFLWFLVFVAPFFICFYAHRKKTGRKPEDQPEGLIHPDGGPDGGLDGLDGPDGGLDAAPENP